MKLKSSLVILLSIVALSSQAQTIKAGFNFANITITNDGDVDKNKMLTSFHVGFTGDIKIAPAIYFQPGILLTGKGSKTSSGNPSGNTYFEATTSPLYVEIPANFVFKSPGKTINIFGGIGPYIAVGIAGKNKTEGKFLNIAFKSEENIKWSDDDPTTLDYEEGSGYGIMRRFDYGVNALAGVEFKQTVISIGYGFGLAKLQSGSNNQADDKNKHRVLSLSVGFKL
ncbi:MAG: outer membrane beta-barrel protein [Chitinophagaceae bacterium]